MVKRARFVPEFQVSRKVRRAGFIPHEDRDEPELWTIWARSSSGEDRRATSADLRRAGFKRRR